MKENLNPIRVQELRKGDIFYELYGGRFSKAFTAIEDARVVVDGDYTQDWCEGQSETGEIIEFMSTRGAEHYGPRLYR